jgi:hypothetical protein
MKISINNEQILELTETQKKVIMNDISEDIFESDMKRRLHWCVEHPSNRFVERNKKSAIEFLKSKGEKFYSSDNKEFADLVFKHAPVKLSDKEKQKHIVKVDGVDCFEIDITTKQLLKSDVAKNCCCVEWSKERFKWVLQHKYERCMERLRKEWGKKLTNNGIKELPLDDEEFANLVFSQPEYKNRSQRESQQ